MPAATTVCVGATYVGVSCTAGTVGIGAGCCCGRRTTFSIMLLTSVFKALILLDPPTTLLSISFNCAKVEPIKPIRASFALGSSGERSTKPSISY
ncbi:MAG: hypothetical protein EBU08_15640 [Micrococcales bacterium]|nr:hypothetical protein [Micrococcales bacterium]